jgi:hypothetical protein
MHDDIHPDGHIPSSYNVRIRAGGKPHRSFKRTRTGFPDAVA